MKILFHNYSDEITTEPAYLFQALQKSGLDAHFWSDRNVGAYDTFDQIQPDVFVSNFRNITPDIVKYLEQSPRINLVLNVTGISDAQMQEVEGFLEAKKIDVPFVFTNSFSHKPLPKTRLKCERIFPAFDLFRVRQGVAVDLVCKEAVLSREFNGHLEKQLAKKEVYHLIQVTEGEKDANFDLRVNASSIQELSQYYKEVSLVGDTDFCSSQLFFDLNFNAHNISVTVEDQENFTKFLSTVFKEDESNEDLALQIKDQMKARHTPFHRAATFLKHLKFQDGMLQVENVKGQLPAMLKEL